jgi:hypothetical protein
VRPDPLSHDTVGTRLAQGGSPAGRVLEKERLQRAGAPLIVDVDATLVTAHSDKEQAAATWKKWKKGYGFHPLTVFAD